MRLALTRMACRDAMAWCGERPVETWDVEVIQGVVCEVARPRRAPRRSRPVDAARKGSVVALVLPMARQEGPRRKLFLPVAGDEAGWLYRRRWLADQLHQFRPSDSAVAPRPSRRMHRRSPEVEYEERSCSRIVKPAGGRRRRRRAATVAPWSAAIRSAPR